MNLTSTVRFFFFFFLVKFCPKLVIIQLKFRFYCASWILSDSSIQESVLLEFMALKGNICCLNSDLLNLYLTQFHIYIYICMYMYVCVCIYIYMCIYIYSFYRVSFTVPSCRWRRPFFQSPRILSYFMSFSCCDKWSWFFILLQPKPSFAHNSLRSSNLGRVRAMVILATMPLGKNKASNVF